MTSPPRILELVDTLDAIVWEADALTWAFSFVSRRAEEILGYPLRRWLEEPDFLREHLHPEDRETTVAFCRRAAEAGEDYKLECRMIAADGRVVWLRHRVRLVAGDGGQALRARGLTIDITPQKAMEVAGQGKESSPQSPEQHFRAIIESGNDLASILDGEGTIRYASPSHERLLGWTSEELAGRNAFDMVHPEDLASVTAKFAAGFGDPSSAAVAEFRYRHKEGGWRMLEGRASNLVQGGVITGAVISSRDVTERHRAETELRQRLAFKRLVVDVSSAIANAAPGELDGAILEALAKVGQYLGASLLFIALTLRERGAAAVAYEWNAEGFPPIGPLLQRVPFEEYSWMRSTLEAQGWAAIEDVATADEAAAPERAWMASMGLRAGRAARMMARGRSVGFIDCVFAEPPQHPLEDDLELLLIVGEICANAIARQQEEAAKSALLELERGLSGILDLREMLLQAQATVATLLRSSMVSIYFAATEGAEFERIAAPMVAQPANATPPGARVVAGHPLYELLQRGELAIADAPGEQPWFPPEDLAPFDIGPFAGAPIMVRGRLRGMICIGRHNGSRPFHSGEVELFQGMARQISVAAHTAEIYREKQAEATVASALVRVGRELISSLDQPVLLQRLTHLAAEMLDGDFSHTYLWSRDEQAFVPVAAHGETAERWEAVRVVRFPGSVLGGLMDRIEGGEVFQVDRTGRQRLLPPGLLGPADAHSVAFIALRRGDETVGTLLVGRRNRGEPFTADQIRIAQGLGQLASLALVNTRVVEELERLSRLKSDFVATISHELRTPLNVIMGYNDLMLDGAFGPLAEQQTEIVERVRHSAGDLLELINATLDVSRLDTGRLPVDRRPVDLSALLAHIEIEARNLRVPPGVRVQWDVGENLPTLFTDPVKVKVVIKNLLANALKFTERGTVRISARTLDGGVEISVEDSGIGIAPEAQALIFEAFRQADSSATRRHGGVGLGLYIVRRLLDLLGGRVSLESQLDRGAIFRVWLPTGTQDDDSTATDAA